jgi:DNA-binding HxlR family transcriptional regulator
MRRKSYGEMKCPIAHRLERVGEWWSILILRDALHGLRRFDEFQKSFGVAPNILTWRLNALVVSGMLEQRRYNEHPPRDEYVLTERGRDFRPMLLTLLASAIFISPRKVRQCRSSTTKPVPSSSRFWSTVPLAKGSRAPIFRSRPGPAKAAPAEAH